MIYRILSAALLLFGFAVPTYASTPKDNALEHRTVSVSTTDGLALSAYISRPKNSRGPLPALFLTQWVSCGSIAPREDRVSLEEKLALAAGYALIRVDRAGEGSSEGPGCDALDYNTEVRHYREALDQLSIDHWVDPHRIVIYGSSLGSTTAPLVADGMNVAGVVVQGGGALTYLERMLHFDRQQLERQADFHPQTIHAEMLRRMEFQRYYLLDKMTPEAIEDAHPHLAGVWDSLLGTDTKPHYGRPHSWHWQAAEKDWLSAWTRINAPVMVVYGQYDQFEPRQSHRIIVDTLNRLRPGTATWLEIPRAGHGLRIYPDPVSAYAWTGGKNRPELFVDPVSKWLRSVVQAE
ncbi:alpha/beta hydrolase [Pontixanthobacter aestiaquae]|uniref:Alpha/beta fold hydrolase n=1 Tax=Pontixanthobacter aestiaquae TaxID=1509367 RepID=A0A844Z512_9SPHN|nr:alpha/beta hydrolase [Pontixanthobacter aestiaquae]MDN3647114.1 alpha/beta hydrolase [Pontixanthobacter aestiaquae]MXO81910.1 alpha/beta fold hydrolase [Pontixanthobacter aestiaquae]